MKNYNKDVIERRFRTRRRVRNASSRAGNKFLNLLLTIFITAAVVVLAARVLFFLV